MASVDQAVIRETAAALRHTCDRILNEGAALTLPAAALRVLHAHFDALFPAAVRGEFAPAAGSPLVATETLQDLQFLSDLVQLTAGLRVTAGTPLPTDAGPDEGPVPLGDFSRLERLELAAVPVCWVRGLQARRPYLRALSCDSVIGTSLVELLAHCGGDQSSPFLWEVLTELSVTRCQLPVVERDALRLAPHITHMDMSHNRLETGDGLDCLAGLQQLNLAANLLTDVPCLSMPAHLSLRWLCLRGNRLEDIEGVEEMLALDHLDVSYNLLLSHAVLRPLLELGRLRSLQLAGNPISCLSDHRSRTAVHLHHNCITGKLVLDGRRLLSSEVPPRRDPPASRTTLVPSSGSGSNSGSGGYPSPVLRSRRNRPSSQPTKRGRAGGATAAAAGSAEKGSAGSTPRQQRRRSTKRRTRLVNMADISDMDSTASITGVMLSTSLNSVTEAVVIAEGQDLPSHLVTRERIAEIRLQMGSDWLHSCGGARVQQLLGLPALPPPTFSIGSMPIESPASRTMNSASGSYTGATSARASRRTPQGTDRPRPPPAAAAAAAADAASPAEPSLYPSRSQNLSWEHETSEEEEEEDEDVTCLVVARRLRSGQEEDVMLTVTPTAVKEKELDAGRTVAEWDLRCVEACHVTKMEPLTVQLNFDTVRKEKRERNYAMEQSEWEELSAALLPIIEARLASELAANALQCIKCAAEFSDGLAKTTADHQHVKAGLTRHVQSCPNCGSNMIIRAEKVSHPNAEVARSPGMLAKTVPKKPPLKKRLSSKRIVASTPRHMLDQRTEAGFLGSSPFTDEAAASGHVSETSSTTKAETHTDSSVSVVTSEPEMAAVRAAGRLTGHTTPERAESHVRSDSDVEVISNPSESSIDVIMDSTARSETDADRPAAEGRETASGRLSAAAAESETAAGGSTWPPMEESSSSGSMTTSVCTVWNKRGSTTTGAPPPPPAPAAAAPDTADLSCTLTPESTASDALDCSAISPLDGSAISPLDGSVTSPLNSSSSADCGRSSESVLASWRRGGDSESESPPDTVEEAGSGCVRFWHADLTRLDHRLQLHLDMNVLQDEEQVVCVAKCTCALEPQFREQECVLIVSSATLYILEITGDHSEQLERWLRPRLSRSLSEVSFVGPLLHYHGVGLQLMGREPSQNTQLLVITRDANRGRLLLQHLTESCGLARESDRWLATQRLQVEHMLSGDAGADLILQQLLFVQLLSGDSDSSDSESAAVPVMLCMTPSDLLLMECDLRWLVPGHGDVKIPMRDREKVANIVGLELLRCAAAGRPGLRLLFEDASSGAEHSWRLSAATHATVADLVTALQQPWAAAATTTERPQAACDLYRTADGDVLRLGRITAAPLTGSWLRVTSERRPTDRAELS